MNISCKTVWNNKETTERIKNPELNSLEYSSCCIIEQSSLLETALLELYLKEFAATEIKSQVTIFSNQKLFQTPSESTQGFLLFVIAVKI